MIGFAPAKINLGLFITGKRPDGFHALESCFWPVQWQDVLEVHKRPEPGLALRVSGIPIPGATDDNLSIARIPCSTIAIQLAALMPTYSKPCPWERDWEVEAAMPCAC